MRRKQSLFGAILISLSLSFSGSAQAQEIQIPEGTKWVKPISGQLIAVQTQGNSTTLSLEFQLRGCADRLLPPIAHIEQKSTRVRVYITAMNAHRAASDLVDCYRLPQATWHMQVPGRHRRPNIQVIFLGVKP